ncbi:MAG: T9SS type B sorting domain-containing protein [Salinimicrobium sp.]
MRSLLLILLLLFSAEAFAQLGFCDGSKGDPIFHEDFNDPSPLSTAITNYEYSAQDPFDGQYTIADDMGDIIGGWHRSLPNTTLSNGNALIVNADDNSSGRFYKTTISGLCQNSSYEFSAFLMNIYNPGTGGCENGGIPINVKFQIWDQTDTFLLKEGNTGDIASSSTAKWERFGLTFKSKPGQGSVILKMFNNGIGGCGNDLAIDDIIFSSCGDLTILESPEGVDGVLDVCQEDAPVDLELTATPDNMVYSQHFYQWQQSSDGENWNDLLGENTADFQTSGISSTTYFRVKVAENAANLSSNLCSSASEPFRVNIVETPAAPVSGGDKTICSNETIPVLSVSVPGGEEVNWYDSATGNVLLAEKSTGFTPSTAGTFYAEAMKQGFSCSTSPRTAVSLEIIEAPETEDEEVYLCQNSSVTIDAGALNMTYSWSTGESSQSIEVSSAGNYSVKITNAAGCSSTKTIEVILVEIPVIDEILSEEGIVEIVLQKEGDFEFSLDGAKFQVAHRFEVDGGIYTAFVRNRNGCETVSRQFVHLVIPKFITPNGDGYNDFFQLKGAEFYTSSKILIFDRYGKILASGPGEGFKWNGITSGKELPADDYWYEIRIDGLEPQKGHFSLLR